MKRILALAYLGFMLFSLSSTAENAISINFLGNEQEDARFYFLECREEILNETKYKISYKNANITVEDLSLLTNREYDAVLLYQKVLQAAVERDLLLPINDTALNHDWTALAVYLSKDDVMYAALHYRNGEIPNESVIKSTINYTRYKESQEKALPKFKYYSQCMAELRKILDEEIKPLITVS